jgi:hypothetical protein
MSTMYRISWEYVDIKYLYLYSNADPMFYKHTTQVVPNSQIPDEHWHLIQKETDSPWSQYNQLKLWADGDIQFIRNVKLYKAISEPEWEEVNGS